MGKSLASRAASKLWRMILAPSVVFVSCALLSKVSAEPLRWIGKDYSKKTLVHTGGNWTADCRLNNASIIVELKHKYVKDFGGQVKQDGQNFTLCNLDVRWAGDVFCHAQGMPIPDRLLTSLDVKYVPANYVMKIETIPRIMPKIDTLDKVQITCRSQYEGRLRWLDFDGNEISSDNRRRVFQEYERTTGASVQDSFQFAHLTFTAVTMDDVGKYYCKKTDPFNSTTEVGINVSVKASAPSFDSTFYHSMVNTGEDAYFQCNTQGSPKPKVTWFDEEERLAWCTGGQNDQCEVDATQKSHYGIINMTLIIKNASYLHDHGHYRCTAENMFGQENKTIVLGVRVKPKIKRQSQNFQGCSTKPGEKCILTCEVEYSVPQPNITWKYQRPNCRNMSQFLTCDPVANMWRTPPKDIGQVNVTLDRFGQNSYKSTFIISSGLQNGFFRCTATNALGTDNYMVRMRRDDVQSHLVPNDNTVRKEQALYIVSAVSCLLVVLLLIAVLKLYQNKKRYGRFIIVDDPIEKLDPERPLIEQTAKLWYDNEWEFPASGIHLVRQLGSGEFGEVHLAEATGVIVPDSKGRYRLKYLRSEIHSPNLSSLSNNYQSYMSAKVAVKKLKQGASDIDQRFLVYELKILIHIGWHPNVVNLLGACTKVNADRGVDVLVIMEYCSNGNMLDFLRTHRKIFSPVWTTPSNDPNAELTLIDLVLWAHQVAQAMQFLASRKCLHRDLAARNVLIGSNFTIKVADFGLARDVYKTTHYTTTTSRVPFKWTAIEALQDGIFTSKSDVWSFGVLVWELFTLGGEPYAILPTPRETLDFLLRGERMAQPSNCPSAIYTMMKECWEKDSSKRPTFAQLVEKIGDFKDSNQGLDNDNVLESKLQQLKSEAGHEQEKGGKEVISLIFTNPSKNIVKPELLSLTESVDQNKSRQFKANEDLIFANRAYENLKREHRGISELV